MKGPFLILLLTVFSWQYPFAQNNLNNFLSPDTLIIELFDSDGGHPKTHTLISIQYYNGTGIIYTYHLRDYLTYDQHNSYHFKRGYFDIKICDSIVQLIIDCKIDSVINDPEHNSFWHRSAGDPVGNCHFYMSKNGKSFSKNIN